MESMFNSMSQQATDAYEKMTKVSQAMWESGQKLSEFQVNALRSYAEMSAEQAKLFMNIHDLESLKDFTTSQASYLSELGQKILRDSKEAMEISAEIRSAFLEGGEKALKPAPEKKSS